MSFFLASPLEQFLLLPDDITKICTIIFGIPIGEDPHTMFDFYHIKDIYNFFLLDIFLIDYLNSNFILTLVNIQYYKLSLFLIGLLLLFQLIDRIYYLILFGIYFSTNPCCCTICFKTYFWRSLSIYK